MKIEKAVKLLLDTYAAAKQKEYVRDPVAYALYHVWQMADGERIQKKQPTDLTGKCGSCVYAAPTAAFGGSPCYVECTNADHLQQYCCRHDISKVRQRTAKACKRYTPRERIEEE